MKSYASIDRLEGDIAVCELELLSIEESKATDYSQKETQMVDISLADIISATGAEKVTEGDILVVEHTEGTITTIYSKDEAEKTRRTDLLKSIIQE